MYKNIDNRKGSNGDCDVTWLSESTCIMLEAYTVWDTYRTQYEIAQQQYDTEIFSRVNYKDNQKGKRKKMNYKQRAHIQRKEKLSMWTFPFVFIIYAQNFSKRKENFQLEE